MARNECQTAQHADPQGPRWRRHDPLGHRRPVNSAGLRRADAGTHAALEAEMVRGMVVTADPDLYHEELVPLYVLDPPAL